MKITSRFAAFAFACVATTACSSPPTGTPLDVSAISGDWQASGIELSISPTGTLHYKNTRGTKVELSGATISGVSTAGFDAGFFGLNTHFVINALPHDVGGKRSITIDGNELHEQVEAPAVAAVDVQPLLPLPADTVLPPAGTLASLQGVWTGSGIHLDIGADGSLDYEHTGLANRHVTGASIDNITASSFDMKLMAISSTFAVSAPPAVVEGEVRMTVDGVVVTKQR